MTDETTLQKLRRAALALVEGETERDPVPDAVAALCARRAGKMVTKRDAEAIEAEFPGLECRIERRYGWTQITWWAPSTRWVCDDEKHHEGHHEDSPEGRKLQALGVPKNPNAGRSLIIAYTERNAYWPEPDVFTGRVESRPGHRFNVWAYVARDERNAQRAANKTTIEAGAVQLDKIAALVDELNLMAADLRAFVDDEATPSELARVVRAALSVDLTKKDER